MSSETTRLFHRKLKVAERAMLAAIAIASLAAWSVAAHAAGSSIDPRAQARQIEARLPKLRKLAFKHEVPLDVMSAAQARELMRQEVHKDLTPAEIQDAREEGVLLGMWPEYFEVEQVALSSDSSQMLGFYIPKAKRMVLLDGDDAALSQVVGPDGKPIAFPYLREMTLAHELTHALQDQYFDLIRLQQIRHDGDRQLAFQAIVEGDATLTGLIYTFKGLEGARAQAALTELLVVRRASQETGSAPLPDTMTMQTQFVYGAGTRFVAYAYKRGGFAAVNQLLRNPPTSTREILDPQKFYRHPSPPPKIEIHGYEKSFSGWRLADQDTLGELMVIATVHQTLGDAENWLPMGNAWRADKLIMLTRGDARTIIGFIEFADPANASHFAATYAHILDLVHQDRVPHLVQARGRTALFLIGESARSAPALTPALWAETTFGTASAPPTRRDSARP